MGNPEITKIEQLAVEHQYHCHQGNYYANSTSEEHECWKDFYGEWGDAPINSNLLFRWDVRLYKPGDQPNDEPIRTGYYMEIFIMGQRKGLFLPNIILSVTDEDVPQILEYLQPRMEHIKKLWEPLK